MLRQLTECKVDDDVLRPEVLVDVTVSVREESEGSAPVIRVDAGCTVLNIARDTASIARPEPDLDERAGSLYSVPA